MAIIYICKSEVYSSCKREIVGEKVMKEGRGVKVKKYEKRGTGKFTMEETHT
jgi:hypothetical protein